VTPKKEKAMPKVIVKVNPRIRQYIHSFLAHSSLSRDLQAKVAEELGVPSNHVRVEWPRIDDSLNTPDIWIEVRFPITPGVRPNKETLDFIAEDLTTLVKEFKGLPKDVHEVICTVNPEMEAGFAIRRMW
jgi:hypothetical protein